MTRPILQALLIADHVYTDAATKKKIVAGIFQQMRFIPAEKVEAEIERRKKSGAEQKVMPIPVRAGSPFVYASLTNLRGVQEFELRYVDLEDERPIFRFRFSIEARDPLQASELVFPLPSLPADKAGVFALELLWGDGDPLGSFRVTVTEGSYDAD